MSISCDILTCYYLFFDISPNNKIRRILTLAEELETIPPHSKGRLTVEYYHQIKDYLHKVRPSEWVGGGLFYLYKLMLLCTHTVEFFSSNHTTLCLVF